MSKIGDIAKRVIGTQTIKIDDIIEQFGGVVTVNGLSFVNYKGEKIPVYRFVEGEGMMFWGGCKKLREFAEVLLEDYDGDLAAVNENFKHYGTRLRFGPITRTKGGNPFRPVANLGEVDLAAEATVDDIDEPEFDADTGEVIGDNVQIPF